MVISIFTLKTQNSRSLLFINFIPYFMCSSNKKTKDHEEHSESKTFMQNLELCEE